MDNACPESGVNGPGSEAEAIIILNLSPGTSPVSTEADR